MILTEFFVTYQGKRNSGEGEDILPSLYAVRHCTTGISLFIFRGVRESLPPPAPAMSIALLNRRLGALGLLARIPAPAPPAVGAAAASSASANRGAPRPSPRCSHSSASSVSAVAGSPSPPPWRRPDAADDDRRPRYSRSPPFLIDASASPSLRAFSSSSSSSVAVAAAEGGGGT